MNSIFFLVSYEYEYEFRYLAIFLAFVRYSLTCSPICPDPTDPSCISDKKTDHNQGELEPPMQEDLVQNELELELSKGGSFT